MVGIDMEKNGDQNFLCLNTHLKISFSWEKMVEMHRLYYNNFITILNEVKIQIV